MVDSMNPALTVAVALQAPQAVAAHPGGGSVPETTLMSQPPFFHIPSGTVRFWVLIDGVPVGASIGRETLHYRYKPNASDDDPLATYTANSAALDVAVKRRVAAGSREPIMLRDPDVREGGSPT